MLADAPLVAFVSTTDLARARVFYGETLGLRVVEQTPFACVLEGGGTMLRVTHAHAVTPAPHTVLGWVVRDIAEAIGELARRGVATERFGGLEQDALGVWCSPSGARIAWFRDPDGNVLSLTQPA